MQALARAFDSQPARPIKKTIVGLTNEQNNNALRALP